MIRCSVAVAVMAIVFSFSFGPPAVAQDMATNGNFERQALGTWTMNGQNTGAQMTQNAVISGGPVTYCWERTPGTNGGNGGLEQMVTLVGGVTYQFDADVMYYNC